MLFDKVWTNGFSPVPYWVSILGFLVLGQRMTLIRVFGRVSSTYGLVASVTVLIPWFQFYPYQM